MSGTIRKPDVGRLDMQEDADYPPRDYSQNSMYHGSHYLEKKLIKPDYGSEEFQSKLRVKQSISILRGGGWTKF